MVLHITTICHTTTCLNERVQSILYSLLGEKILLECTSGDQKSIRQQQNWTIYQRVFGVSQNDTPYLLARCEFVYQCSD